MATDQEKIVNFLMNCSNPNIINNEYWVDLYNSLKTGIYDYLLRRYPNVRYITDTYIYLSSAEVGLYEGFDMNIANVESFDIGSEQLEFYFIKKDEHVYFCMLVLDSDKYKYIEFDPSGNNNFNYFVDIFMNLIEIRYLKDPYGNLLTDDNGMPKQDTSKVPFFKKTNYEIHNLFYNKRNYQEITDDYCCFLYSLNAFRVAYSIFENYGNLNRYLEFLNFSFTIHNMKDLTEEFINEIYPIVYGNSTTYKEIYDAINKVLEYINSSHIIGGSLKKESRRKNKKSRRKNKKSRRNNKKSRRKNKNSKKLKKNLNRHSKRLKKNLKNNIK